MDTAVILCAGLARRMGNNDIPKQLIKVAGREILYRTVAFLSQNGIKRFLFVVNHINGKRIESFVRNLGIEYTLIKNEKPERENGYSLYLAKDHLEGKFVLTMGDHLYSEEFIEQALKGEGLMVDRLGLFISREEATKVLCKEGIIADIGKEIQEWTGFDTGFFVLEDGIFKTAERLAQEREKVTLSEIVKEAGVKCTFISGEFWMDVDTPEDAERARKAIVRLSVKGTGDGFIARHLNRKVSLAISEKVVDRITPDQATWITFAVGILSALTALLSPFLGGILYQLSSMLDGVDGEIARASMRTTRFGGYLDSILDRYVDFLFLSALSLWMKPPPDFLPWILFAIFGSFMVSYSTERYRGAYGSDAYRDLPSLGKLPGKRDERIFLTMLFCLFGWIGALFVILAVVTNLRVLLTLYITWKEGGGT